MEKISVIGVDPCLIPEEKFNPEVLPPVEATDLLSYLVLDTSFYTKQQFKQGWISDMGIDGPTFVPKSGYFLIIWVKVCPQKLAFS